MVGPVSDAPYHGAMLRVFNAWNDQGINPTYHERMRNQLRREWPVLAKALDALNPVESGPY